MRFKLVYLRTYYLGQRCTSILTLAHLVGTKAALTHLLQEVQCLVIKEFRETKVLNRTISLLNKKYMSLYTYDVYYPMIPSKLV